ncbi:MAG: HD domain-containing protein [Oligoflexales bacterium]|nr:HD domain-containing protein [Oligoflexales bacterium]
MALEIVRRVRGNLHGSIDLSALEDLVVAHPIMQRMRRIKQTAFLSYVFPGATHTRFEHSLGVMHLAGVAWEKIWSNQKRLKASLEKFSQYELREKQQIKNLNHGMLAPTLPLIESISHSDYILQALRLAALMHDLGHPAFSHSGERFLTTLNNILHENSDLPSYLNNYLQLKSKNSSAHKADVKAKHEIYTLIFIEKILSEIYQKNPNIYPKIDPRDVIAMIKPEVGLAEGSPLAVHQIDTLCHELISGEIDVDRMDYLLRDSKESGVIYGIFDANRILDSLLVYQDVEEGRLHLAIQYSGLAAFEDYLRARQSMYLQLYFHKTSVAAEAMLKKLSRMLGSWSLPASWQAYAKIDEYNIYQILYEEGEKRIKDNSELKIFLNLLDDLILNRNLWKRVFEVTTTKLSESENSNMERASLVIQNHQINFERISSSTALTRFSQRSDLELSKNYLRLVKKDEFRFPRVIPIEDHSDLIKHNNSRQIHRLYIENIELPGNRHSYDVISQALMSKFQ